MTIVFGSTEAKRLLERDKCAIELLDWAIERADEDYWIPSDSMTDEQEATVRVLCKDDTWERIQEYDQGLGEFLTFYRPTRATIDKQAVQS